MQIITYRKRKFQYRIMTVNISIEYFWWILGLFSYSILSILKFSRSPCDGVNMSMFHLATINLYVCVLHLQFDKFFNTNEIEPRERVSDQATE